MIDSANTLMLPRKNAAAPGFLAPGRKEALLGAVTANLALPRPPGLVLRVLESASRPDCSLDELSELIHHDPALCGKLLQTVNSAIFGLRQPARSADQALKLLGLRQIRSLVLSLSLPAMYQKCTPNDAMRDHWRSSITVAIAARELSYLRGGTAPAEDLVAGLLCDLGTIVLQQIAPEEVERLLVYPADRLALEQCELEEEIIGISHAEVGAHLLTSWGLPAEITQAVRFHHEPASAGREGATIGDRTALLHFATQIANLPKGSKAQSTRQLIEIAEKRFGMSEAEFAAFLESLTEKVSEFASLLRLDIGANVDYGALMVNATQELAKLTVEANLEVVKARHNEPQSAMWRLFKAANSIPANSAMLTVDNHKGKQVNEAEADTGLTPKNAALVDCPGGRSPEPHEEINLGQYTVINVLGRGGMGIVFRAFDTSLRRHVAIKVLGPWLSAVPISRKRFVVEAQTSASISHENVVAVYAVEDSGEFPYMVMEYVEGMSLQERLESGSTLTPKEILQISVQIADGLAAAHAKGVIHRDVKPANVLLRKDQLQAKIADFGLARIAENPGMTAESAIVGTPQYMSPEQARGDTVDFRSDLFSLGGVIYAMCTGTSPFGADHTMKILTRVVQDSPTPITNVRPDIPREMVAIIDKLHAKDPALRFQSASEVGRQLRRQLYLQR